MTVHVIMCNDTPVFVVLKDKERAEALLLHLERLHELNDRLHHRTDTPVRYWRIVEVEGE